MLIFEMLGDCKADQRLQTEASCIKVSYEFVPDYLDKFEVLTLSGYSRLLGSRLALLEDIDSD